MELSEVTALLTTEALALLATTPPPSSGDDVVSMVSSLRKAGHSPELVGAVMNQLGLRAKAIEKFGEFAPRMLYTKPGLEQATRLGVASHHAARMHSAGITSVADAGCGIGGDALAFAGLGLRVHAFEADEATAALAAYNLAPLENAEVFHRLVEDADFGELEALWCDPARREGGTRLANPDDWSPSLEWVFDKASQMPSGIKLAPGMDRSLIPPEWEAQWVSYQGSVVEMVLWTGVLARPGVTRSALVINHKGIAEMFGAADAPDAPVGEMLDYLVEPDGAVIRARLIGDLARQHDGHMMDSTIAYFTADKPVATPLAQCFRIREVIPYSVNAVEALVAKAELGTIDIKKRGIDIDPHSLRKTFSLKGSGQATLILTRAQGKKVAILADRVENPATLVSEDVASADEES